MTPNKLALRSKARSASSGEWIKESGDGWEAICSSDDQANGNFIIAHFEGPDAKANREFAQVANPDTVLSLLDELEAAEKRNAELEALILTASATDVLAERQRQISAEGWNPEHDDEHVEGQLSDAAACYALFATDQGKPVPAHWPWSDNWWKQSGQRRDLVKAGALILAEIERIDRAAGIKIKGE